MIDASTQTIAHATAHVAVRVQVVQVCALKTSGSSRCTTDRPPVVTRERDRLVFRF